ncbi:hypothetical protein Tcan_04687 [Toxocara canis]|uniref:Integrator complex subunit 10 n=1 Tax=Toxocara canis TaxID=6265 RepID=A0A0B2VPH5_TOXCA|nr:hypothetical protein Tcan_04687 [Toxocara canis]
MVSKMNAKYHLERCLKEERDYSIGKAHCRLASLYKDYDPQLRDITELQFQVKWKRCNEAVPVLERIVKSHPSDEAWAIIHKMFMTATSQSTSVERDIFLEVSTDILESILSGLSKRFDSNDSLKTKLLLFAVQASTEEKHAKLVIRAITYLSDKVNADSGIVSGVGKYHIYIAIIVAPTLLKRNLTHVPLTRMLNIMMTTIHVALVWTFNRQQLEDLLKEASPSYANAADNFTANSWDIISALIDKSIQAYDLGPALNVQAHSSESAAVLKCIDKAMAAKAELKKILMAFFVWRAYSLWRRLIAEDELLAWQPVSNWSTDVDKIIDDKAELSTDKGTPSKKSRSSRERRDKVVLSSTTKIANSINKEICDAYELCSAAVCSFTGSASVSECEENLRLANFFPDVQQFISESLLFKCKLDEAISHFNERLDRDDKDAPQMDVLSVQLACANALARNWSDACECLFGVMLSVSKYKRRLDRDDKDAPQMDVLSVQLACANALARNWSDACECLFGVMLSVSKYKREDQTESDDDKPSMSTNQSNFLIIKRCDMEDLIYDILHHIFFKIYTSTAVDHENDQLLGTLLVLSQYKFSEKGFQSFNRIMRHIEAKGSLNYPGLVTHITNMAILEEISRVQEYCTEYVTIQVALPQVHRRIGQSTRHSVRGTKDGQRQSLEEQMKKWRNNPIETVSGYFLDEKENILKLLESR